MKKAQNDFVLGLCVQGGGGGTWTRFNSAPGWRFPTVNYFLRDAKKACRNLAGKQSVRDPGVGNFERPLARPGELVQRQAPPDERGGGRHTKSAATAQLGSWPLVDGRFPAISGRWQAVFAGTHKRQRPIREVTPACRVSYPLQGQKPIAACSLSNCQTQSGDGCR